MWISGADLTLEGALELVNTQLGYAEVTLDCSGAVDRCPHAVLPRKEDGKLCFNFKPIESLVYGTPELRVALAMGYELKTFHGGWFWRESKHGLFSEYINTFYQMKAQADRDKNMGKRAVAKLCLNSFWGKLGQRSNQSRVEIVDRGALDEYFGKVEANEIDLQEVAPFNDKYMIDYKSTVEDDKPLVNTNVGVGFFTTMYARLRLFEVIQQLGDRAVYCDTDSIIYFSPTGVQEVPTGEALGCWKNEQGDGWLTRFASIGPKMYCYETNLGKTETRTKGIHLTGESEAVATFDNLWALETVCSNVGHELLHEMDWEDGLGPITSVPQHGIRRDFQTFELRNYSMIKRVRSTTHTKGDLLDLVSRELHCPGSRKFIDLTEATRCEELLAELLRLVDDQWDEDA
jgi:hypothetical protein